MSRDETQEVPRSAGSLFLVLLGFAVPWGERIAANGKRRRRSTSVWRASRRLHLSSGPE